MKELIICWECCKIVGWGDSEINTGHVILCPECRKIEIEEEKRKQCLSKKDGL